MWSVVIPTHNRYDLLVKSLSSVLDQGIAADRMEIEVMDDASTELKIRDVVDKYGQGRVSYYRQPTNRGQFANVNDGIRRARGRWIHILHDDDWIAPDFYNNLEIAISHNPDSGAALTSIAITNAEGETLSRWPRERETAGPLEDWLWKVSTSARIQTPAVVVKRETYEVLGGYNPFLPWPGDWEMWIRIASHFDWIYQPNSLAFYRDNETSVSSRAKQTGSNISDIRNAIDFFRNYIPNARQDEIIQASKRYWAFFALRTARNMIRKGDYEAAANQLRECLATEPSKDIVFSIINLSRNIS